MTVDPALAKDLLSEVLDADAAKADETPAAPPPPRSPWLLEDGTPRWGLKPDGTPRRARPGTGRPPKDDKPRTAKELPPGNESPAREPTRGTTGRDYTDQIAGALSMTWMGMAAVPFTRAHAAVLHAHIPDMIPAWNTAAQQNATIRHAIEKLSGDGSWSWVIPVTVVTTPVVLGMWQVTRDGDLRTHLAAQTEKDFREFLTEQAAAAGIDLDEVQLGHDGWPVQEAEVTDAAAGSTA
ncbi:MAG TPA: hypothetical protein VH307_31225 [Streptosporangiaceae bacterium]|nr:hypothetical protein [Streptosporangiaceae bacterium]